MADFVPYSRRETYQLHNIPPAHLRNIHRRGATRSISYADVVAKVLTERCQIPFVPSQRRRLQEGSWNTSLSVRVPVEVMQCVREEAERDRITMRSVILNALSDAFGLKRPPTTHVEPGSRPGRRKGQ
jgi:hypothetical protein